MKGVYAQNPQMGDPSSLEPQISETAQNIGRLKGDLAKYEVDKHTDIVQSLCNVWDKDPSFIHNTFSDLLEVQKWIFSDFISVSFTLCKTKIYKNSHKYNLRMCTSTTYDFFCFYYQSQIVEYGGKWRNDDSQTLWRDMLKHFVYGIIKYLCIIPKLLICCSLQSWLSEAVGGEESSSTINNNIQHK